MPANRTFPALAAGVFGAAQLGAVAEGGPLATIVVRVDSVMELVEDINVVLFLGFILDISETVLVKEEDVESVLEGDLISLEIEGFFLMLYDGKSSAAGTHCE